MRNHGLIKGRAGQTLPSVILAGAVLAIFAYALLFLFTTEVKLFVKQVDIVRKDELASLALEHARYKIQTGSTWFNVPLAGFMYDKEYTVEGIGSYYVTIEKGNLFASPSGADYPMQGKDEFRTIGIKVKVSPSGDAHQYYAVIKRTGFGGPLISKGFIDLPCSTTAINDGYVNIFWGDIYHANPVTGTCKIPIIRVGQGGSFPQPWMPAVYSKTDIYTAINVNGSNYTFGTAYNDMYPTARSHPYSAYAKAPDIDLNKYKKIASEQNKYFGPPVIGGSGAANPYYCGRSLTQVSGTYIAEAMTETSHVVFIDTTDALPVRVPLNSSTPTNTYSGATISTSTYPAVAVYNNDSDQLYMVGSLAVMGPLILKGDQPSTSGGGKPPGGGATIDPSTEYWPSAVRVRPPSNFYYPQGSLSPHYSYNGTNINHSVIDEIKLGGFLYIDGELKIGGVRCTSGTCAVDSPVYLAGEHDSGYTSGLAATGYRPSLFGPAPAYAGAGGGGGGGGGSAADSSICIYGTVYLGEHGSIRFDLVNDTPQLWMFYNTKSNPFASIQENVAVVSFKEITYLVPTPAPYYP